MRLIESFGTTPELAEFFSDNSVLGALLCFETALARAEGRLGIIPAEAAESIVKAADAERFDAAGIAADARESATIVVPFVKALSARVEEIDSRAAEFVHWGTTSQDAIDTAVVLLLRRARETLARDEARLEEMLRALSDRHAATVMPARTLLQPAPPITFGYKVAGWFGGIRRSWRRLARSFDQALVLQFGGISGTLAAFGDRGPELAEEVGRELNLKIPEAPWHTHRDRLASVVTNCGILTGSLGKIARDISLLMQSEVGEAAERGGGSSAMPNKRNPSSSVVALAAAARVPSLVAAYLAAMTQEHERAAGGWQSEWQTVAEIVQATGSALAAIADAIEGLTVNPDRMLANVKANQNALFAGERAAQPEHCLGAAETFRRALLDAAGDV